MYSKIPRTFSLEDCFEIFCVPFIDALSLIVDIQRKA